MAIDAKDFIYNNNIDRWRLVRDCVEGEKSVKARGVTYLREFYPGLSASDPNKWAQFLQQTAEFPNVTKRMHAAVSGAMMRQEYSLEAPDEIKEELENGFGTTNAGLISLISDVVNEDIITCRTGILVDRDESGEGLPYPRVYRAEDIVGINEEIRYGKPFITSVRLYEAVEMINDDYEQELVNQIRELGIDESGYYFQRLWRGESKANVQTITSRVNRTLFGNTISNLSTNGDTAADSYTIVMQDGSDEQGRVYPRMNNQPFDYIPFWLANGSHEECKPLLEDIAEQNIHLYNKVSYDNWAYYVYNTVTPFVSGVSEDEAGKFALGSVWHSTDPEAKVTVVGGQADVLNAGREKIRQNYETIASLGATMFAERSSNSESAAALRIKNAPQSAVVGAEARALSHTLTYVLRFAVYWMTGTKNDDISIQIHNVTTPETVEPATLTAVIQGYINGGVPIDALLNVLDKADVLPASFDPIKAADELENRAPEVQEVP